MKKEKKKYCPGAGKVLNSRMARLRAPQSTPRVNKGVSAVVATFYHSSLSISYSFSCQFNSMCKCYFLPIGIIPIFEFWRVSKSRLLISIFVRLILHFGYLEISNIWCRPWWFLSLVKWFHLSKEKVRRRKWLDKMSALGCVIISIFVIAVLWITMVSVKFPANEEDCIRIDSTVHSRWLPIVPS